MTATSPPAHTGVTQLPSSAPTLPPLFHVQVDQATASERADPLPPDESPSHLSPSSSYNDFTFATGPGPRLTKSAALRMGLEWDDPRDARRVSGEEIPVDFDNVPGHKRSGLEVHVASLAEPTLAPRQNRAALLRAGQPVEKEEIRDRAEMGAANKAREAAERAEKRRSVPLPASLLAPSPGFEPRQNRAAMLRAGVSPVEEVGRSAAEMAEKALRNKAREAAERAERRRSIASPASLAAPLIAPRGNRSSMLRANKDKEADLAARPLVSPPPRPPRSHARTMSTTSRSTTTSTAATTGTTASTGTGTGTTRSTSPVKRANAPTGAEMAAARRLAAQQALEERAEAARKEKLARRQTMQPLRSLREPIIAPRTNRSSVLRGGRENIPEVGGVRTNVGAGMYKDSHRNTNIGTNMDLNTKTDANMNKDTNMNTTMSKDMNTNTTTTTITPMATTTTPTNTSTHIIPQPATAEAKPLSRADTSSSAISAISASSARSDVAIKQPSPSRPIPRPHSRRPAPAPISIPPSASALATSSATPSGPISVPIPVPIPPAMPTPTRFVQPRPAPAPPPARPVSISFALPEKSANGNGREKRNSIFAKLLKPGGGGGGGVAGGGGGGGGAVGTSPKIPGRRSSLMPGVRLGSHAE